MTLLKDQISLIELVDECIRKLENEYRLEDHDENTPMSDSLIGIILKLFNFPRRKF